nr:MAG: hypothetical protein [Microvirus sp.]
MKYRRKMCKRESRRNFMSRSAPHRKNNLNVKPMRGGFRI